MSKEEVEVAISALEASVRTIDFWVLIFSIGVAVSLAAEVILGVAHWQKETQLRPLRAEQARLHAIEIADLGKIAEEAKRTAETERLARVQLEERLAPRRLSPDQQATVTVALKPFAGKTVRFDSYGLDAEAAVLGPQLQKALAEANINIDSGLMTRASGGSIALGVYVIGKDQDLVRALIIAFLAAKIATSPDDPSPGGFVSFGNSMAATTPDAMVFVGVKPIVP